MYEKLTVRLFQPLKDFPTVEFEDVAQVHTALEIGSETGLDWVDCMFITESLLNKSGVFSLDIPLLKALDFYRAKVSSNKRKPSSPSEMDLG